MLRRAVASWVGRRLAILASAPEAAARGVEGDVRELGKYWPMLALAQGRGENGVELVRLLQFAAHRGAGQRDDARRNGEAGFTRRGTLLDPASCEDWEFPNFRVDNLKGETFWIRDRIREAKATILLVSAAKDSVNLPWDWCVPFKRQFVDHPDVQVLEMTVNLTLLELVISSWTTMTLKKRVPERRFEGHLVYNGRCSLLQSALAKDSDGFVLLLDKQGVIRWMGGATSRLNDLVGFSNSVLKTINDADHVVEHEREDVRELDGEHDKDPQEPLEAKG